MVFGREYSWGNVDATDEKVSDFYSMQLFVRKPLPSLHNDASPLILSPFLKVQNNADDLKQRTIDVVYEEYRKARLAALKTTPSAQS